MRRLFVESVRGRREIAARDYFKGLYDTARRPDELLIEARLPVMRPNTVSVFLELARRHGDFAIAGLAFALTMESGLVTDGRLVYFASEDTPTLASRRARRHQGQASRLATAQEAAAAALAGDLSPMTNAQGSARMRLHLQRVLTRRALAMAQERTSARAAA